jgi:Domain of unknown function (DUF3382)
MTIASELATENPVRPTLDWSAHLKDAPLGALVAGLLAVPLMGLQTYDIGGGALGIRTHLNWVVIAAVAVFIGRLALHLLQRFGRGRQSGGKTALAYLATWRSRRIRPNTVAGMAFAVAFIAAVFIALPDRSRHNCAHLSHARLGS